ncbi:MAG: response regulator transcription factor [Deltaproteobacteria bacterium]|nr:response regulator transcription factor [Deltaproteobacteria bacterium]MBW2136724.1 response regulator transcription factor [Deltaproteobacteria bacterium]
MKVLIAEDDATTRGMLESMLAKWGYEVQTTQDGDDAWRILRAQEKPQLVLLDWLMPGIDGVEICKRLKTSPEKNTSYVIMLTVKDKKEDIVSGLNAGADDYITKPFDHEELKARIKAGARIIKLQMDLKAKIQQLQDALSHIKTLQGILPICMHCHKIRTDEEAWQQLEAYLQHHTDVRISHALCPECFKKYYPDLYEEDD